jgi:hypothetical protein
MVLYRESCATLHHAREHAALALSQVAACSTILYVAGPCGAVLHCIVCVLLIWRHLLNVARAEHWQARNHRVVLASGRQATSARWCCLFDSTPLVLVLRTGKYLCSLLSLQMDLVKC